VQNYCFLLVFIFEFVLKHIGIGFQQYWGSPFDAFDGTVVLISIVFVFVPGGAIAGLFRIGRVFRLIKRAPALQALMTSMVMTVPAISNVFAVMGLLFFIFAVIGVEMFSSIRYGFAINQVDNYQTWAMSMLALWRATLGNWRSNMYDCMVSAPMCTEDFEQIVLVAGGGNYTYIANDCGKPSVSILYHTLFQILSTFAVLNVVIAIILGAFTWCYSLEESELTEGLAVTADDLRHFKQIWDRFDIYSTSQIPIKDLQLFLAVVKWNVPKMFCTGVVTQQGKLLYKDYSSFGSGGRDPDTGERLDSKEPEKGRREKVCRKNYDFLVEQIGDFERSHELWVQLEDAGCDVWMGGNDNVAGFDISRHPLGSVDADLHIFTKEVNNGIIYVPQYTPNGWDNGNPVKTRVDNVSFMSLINLLVMAPLGLNDHDVYVCFDFKDPFSYFQPGYFGDKKPLNGKVVLNTDPNSIRMDFERPAFYQQKAQPITVDDLAGTYTIPDKNEEEMSLITDDTSSHAHSHKANIAVRPTNKAFLA